MQEILPGIYQMTLTLSGFNPGSVNVYLIKTDSGYISIDTGWDSPPSVRSMEKQLAEIGASISDIEQVIITHCHIDHLGMIARLKKSQNVKIYLHRNEIDLIKTRFTNGDNYIPMTDKFLHTHGVPHAELPPPEIQLPISPDLVSTQPDVLLQGGEEMKAGKYVLQVINTPGHTPGHIALYEPEKKFIFSGDMLLPTIATNAAIHVQHIPNPLQKYLDSLLVLRELDIETVLPGHEYVCSNHRQRIDELIRHQQDKAEEVRKAFTGGQPKTAYEVSRVLSWSPQSRTTNWTSLTGWDKRFAVLQTIAHLEEMVAAKKLTGFSQDGKIYYR
jgi:glyoxylase-like metal-dependent hydrolase (beta-lactamase superfamily II)